MLPSAQWHYFYNSKSQRWSVTWETKHVQSSLQLFHFGWYWSQDFQDKRLQSTFQRYHKEGQLAGEPHFKARSANGDLGTVGWMFLEWAFIAFSCNLNVALQTGKTNDHKKTSSQAGYLILVAVLLPSNMTTKSTHFATGLCHKLS